MEKLFEMSVIQENDIEMGRTCRGETLISPAEGGVFSGDRLSGEIVPIGIGATYTPSPGINDIEATMLLRTDDGARILMDMNAYFDIDAEDERRLMNGESIPPEDYYYKGTVGFKTDSDKYRWLERKVCVCTAAIDNWEKVNLSVYMV